MSGRRVYVQLWDSKEGEYDTAVEEQLRRLAEAQRSRLDDFAAEAAARAPRRPQPSKSLLEQRSRQAALAKLGQYEDAEAVQRLADRLEAAETAAARDTYEAEMAFKEQQLRAKQQAELEGLLERAARGREQLRAARLADQERRQRRFRNVLSELESLQRLEFAQLEHFLMTQQLAGKRGQTGASPPRSPPVERSFSSGGAQGGTQGGAGGLAGLAGLNSQRARSLLAAQGMAAAVAPVAPPVRNSRPHGAGRARAQAAA